MMLDITQNNAWGTIFFDIFLVINTILLANILIGIFYFHYKKELVKIAEKIEEDYDYQKF